VVLSEKVVSGLDVIDFPGSNDRSEMCFETLIKLEGKGPSLILGSEDRLFIGGFTRPAGSPRVAQFVLQVENACLCFSTACFVMSISL
jgi:hypothetical protein